MKVYLVVFPLLVTFLHHQHNTCEAIDIWNNLVRPNRGAEFLVVASIGLKNYGHYAFIPVYICSGVLITRKHVLTLAHCINEVNDLKDVRVNLGHKYLAYATEYRIQAWTTYKFWAKDKNISPEPLEHDISILKLDEKADREIIPAVITKRSKEFFYGKRVNTIVWGTTEIARTAMVLRVAELDVLSYEDCSKELNNTQLMTKIHILDKAYLCTKINLSAVLEDTHSGSPLFSKKNKLIAINDPTYLQRHGIPIPTNLNFHVGLDYYKTFIKSATETRCAKWWKWIN